MVKLKEPKKSGLTSQWIFAMSREAEDTIQYLAHELGMNIVGVFKQAISLLLLAMRAKKHGYRLVVVDDNDNILVEVVGYNVRTRCNHAHGRETPQDAAAWAYCDDDLRIDDQQNG